jgi:hypothetical protein
MASFDANMVSATSGLVPIWTKQRNISGYWGLLQGNQSGTVTSAAIGRTGREPWRAGQAAGEIFDPHNAIRHRSQAAEWCWNAHVPLASPLPPRNLPDS